MRTATLSTAKGHRPSSRKNGVLFAKRFKHRVGERPVDVTGAAHAVGRRIGKAQEYELLRVGQRKVTKQTVFMTLKTAVFPPMPRARVSIADEREAGAFAQHAGGEEAESRHNVSTTDSQPPERTISFVPSRLPPSQPHCPKCILAVMPCFIFRRRPFRVFAQFFHLTPGSPAPFGKGTAARSLYFAARTSFHLKKPRESSRLP